MKIVILIYSMSSGGAERVVAHLANEWAKRNWEVTIITIAPRKLDFYKIDSSVSRISLDLDNNSRTLAQGISANFLRILAVRREVRKLSPDIVLGFMHDAAVISLLACMRLDVSVIGLERNHPPMQPLSFLWEQVRKWTYPHARKIVMLTNDGLNWLSSTIPQASGTVIPNPVIYPLARNQPELVVESLFPADRKILLAVGRLEEQKGLDYLLLAFAELAKKHPGWDLVIIGEGALKQVLIEQMQGLDLNSRVRLLGRAGNVGDWYRRADLYVLSSRYEGFPNTLLEAMAHGCAVVSYDCDTGPRDMIRHEVNGLLVSPTGDVPALTVALDKLMGDDHARQRMGQEATKVRDDYSLKNIMMKWDKLLEESIL